MKRSIHSSVLLVASAIGLALAVPATANTKNLHNPSAASGPHQDFGSSTAISDRYALVGETGNRTRGTQAGAAHLFDVKSGHHLRRLLAPDTAAAHRFGFSVAISGNRALIGAPGAAANRGRVYLFELSSGRLLRRIDPPAIVSAGAQFGTTVALNGRHAVIGAPYDIPFGTTLMGSAHVFDVSSGEFLHSKTSIHAPDNALFGKSVALDGKVFVVGAPGEFNQPNGTRTGAVHVYDLVSGERLHRLLATDGQYNDALGSSVAVGSGFVVAGAPTKSDVVITEFGSVYVFDVGQGTQVRELKPGISQNSQQYGRSVSISGRQMVIGAPGDTISNTSAVGAVYVVDFTATGTSQYRLVPLIHEAGTFYGRAVANCGHRMITGFNSNQPHTGAGAANIHSNLASVWSQRIVAQKGAQAPNADAQRHGSFRLPMVNHVGQIAFGSGLIGEKSGRQGTWAELVLGVAPTLLTQTGNPLNPQTRAGAPISLVQHNMTNAVLETRVAGSSKDRALYRINLGLRTLLLRSGAPVPGHNGALLRDFSSPCQFANSDRLAVPYRLRVGVENATAADDSGVIALNHLGVMQSPSFREGGGIGNFLGTFRQFLPRSAINATGDQTAFAAYRTPLNGGTATELALFTRATPASQTQLVAHSGQNAPQVTGAVFRNFLGETLREGELIFRATLAGEAGVVSAANREGLWMGQNLCLRQGQSISPNGPRVSRILRFWPSITDHLLTLVRLSGKGVSSTNDLALLCVKRDGAVQVLLREGAPVEGSEGSRIGVIQRVEACQQSGRYLVLTSLTGASFGNQALHSGEINLPEPNQRLARRLPSLKLRKGTLWAAQGGQTPAIRSLTLQPHATPGGAGSTGHRVVLNPQGRAIFGVRFSNGTELLTEGSL